VRGLSRGSAGTGDDLPEVVARLAGDEDLDRSTRASLLARAALALGRPGRKLVDVVTEVAPHLPVRDLATLRRHYGGLSGEELAAALIGTAARSTAAIGAAGGLLSTAEIAAPPLLLSAPVLVGAETLAVVAVELKLVAELHEVYYQPVPGTPAVRAAAYLGAWARRRAFDPFAGNALSMTGVISGAARRELRQRLIRRAGRNLTTVVPFLAGAVAGAALNQRETRRLGEHICTDLRRPRDR
jgi:hypothetical protein